MPKMLQMSGNEAIIQSLRPSSQRLYESSKCLASCLKSHQEAKCTTVENVTTAAGTIPAAAEKPTLAAMARHYRLGQLLRVIAPLIVVQERLFRRLEKRPNSTAKGTFPDLFKAMDRESKAILKICHDFCVEKEDRYKMEGNINLIRESLEMIIEAFRMVEESQYESPGRLNNKMADVVDDLRVDWTVMRSIRENLPARYPIDYGLLQEKTSS